MQLDGFSDSVGIEDEDELLLKHGIEVEIPNIPGEPVILNGEIQAHCTKNWIYSHLLMSEYDANAVQMCGKHGKCRIYFTFT